MAKGISLHIGVNRIDPGHYGTDGTLAACEFDANDMQQIAQDHEFEDLKLLTTAATRNAVISGIQDAAKSLDSGDIFFLSYAGHGSQIPDTNNDEPDGRDETWCLYDGMLIDDELHRLWGTFKDGVRILVVSDSCHSGTVTRALNFPPVQEEGLPAERFLPEPVALRTFRTHRGFYEDILKKLKAELEKAKKATQAVKQKAPDGTNIVLVSGCQDNQTSLDGRHNGLFTGTLLSVWNEGKFEGNYKNLHSRIVARMPARQTPNLYSLGGDTTAFLAGRPFEV